MLEGHRSSAVTTNVDATPAGQTRKPSLEGAEPIAAEAYAGARQVRRLLATAGLSTYSGLTASIKPRPSRSASVIDTGRQTRRRSATCAARSNRRTPFSPRPAPDGKSALEPAYGRGRRGLPPVSPKRRMRRNSRTSSAAVVRAQRMEVAVRIVDDSHVERAIPDGKRGHRRHFHLGQHPGLFGTLARALGRCVVRHDRVGTFRQADFGRNGPQTASIRACDLREAARRSSFRPCRRRADGHRRRLPNRRHAIRTVYLCPGES